MIARLCGKPHSFPAKGFGVRPRIRIQEQSHVSGTDPPQLDNSSQTFSMAAGTQLALPCQNRTEVPKKKTIDGLPSEHRTGSSKALIPTLRDGYTLPFDIPEDSTLRQIGNTPLVEVEDGIFGKLEGFNFSGTIKDRMITNMVLAMFGDGTLQNGSTISLVTSGSAGIALMATQKYLQEDCGISLKVVIMMPKAYVSKAQRIISGGATVMYDQPCPDAKCQLVLFDGTFADSVATGKAVSTQNGYSQLDQHYDINGMLGHESTAIEIMSQVPDVTDVVCATGSGATCGGLRTFLDRGISVHARPSVSGTIAGLGDITKYNNFCQPHLIKGYSGGGVYDPEVAQTHQDELIDMGIHCGPSSGATLWLARQIKSQREDAKIVFIAADGSMDMENAEASPDPCEMPWTPRALTRRERSFTPTMRTRQLHRLVEHRGAITAPVRHRHTELLLNEK
jgi:cysteine synthase A